MEIEIKKSKPRRTTSTTPPHYQGQDNPAKRVEVVIRGNIFGKIKAPPSKSYTHRALVLAALSDGKSKIISPLSSDDTEVTIDYLRKIGVKIKKRKGIWENEF